MADETLSFSIIARDQASGAFRETGRSAADLAGKMDLAARNARVLDEALGKQRKTTDVLAGATLAGAKADKILADAEHVLSDRALEADFALRKQAAAAKKAGDSSAEAAGGVSALAGGGGIPGGGMGAAIAAGVALSPIIATLGVGLAGFGAAAVGVIKPISDAAQKTGGLSANMKLLNPEQQAVASGLLGLGKQYDRFQKALQPEVFRVFNSGLHLAGGLLHDVEPVAKATGNALSGLVDAIDAEFRSNNWQNFFHFMAQTAGPDVKLLSADFVSLSSTLPTLLEGLQPVASALLTVVNYTGQAIRLSELASTNFSALGKSAQKSGDGFNATTEGLKAAIPGMEYVSKLGHEIGSGLDVLYGNSAKAGKGLDAFGSQVYTTGKNADTAGAKLQTMAQAVTALSTAESKALDAQLAYSGDLITSANDAVALRKALKASGDQIGLHTQAQRASFQAANTYISDLENTAKQSWASGKGTDGAIAAIRGGLPVLESAKTHSKQYWQEVQILVSWLHKLEQQKQIHDVVKLSGNGSWTFGLSGTGSFPSRHIKGRAAGWLVPGFGGGDRHPALLEGGEAVVPKHLTPSVAPFLKAHGVPGFASGGLVPGYSGSVAGLKPWGQSNYNATLQAMTQAFVTAGKAQQSAFSSVSGPASYGVTRWAGLILKVLAMLGQSSANLGAVEHRMQQESGGNPFAINLTDSNAAAGDPSRGLMQTIGSTFARYRSWSLPDNIYNPEANIFAGLNYALHAYPGRSLSSVMLQAGGYDNGGWLPTGVSIAVNKTGRPERVIPHGRGGGAASGSASTIVLDIRLGGAKVGHAVIDLVQKHVEVTGGGDVQVALGSVH